MNISGSSFRDPDGFLFESDNVLYRQINSSYKQNYSRLMDSGLYDKLTGSGMLIRHQEADVDMPASDIEALYKIIRPDPVPFISYPYEWCFEQLKDAALLTLDIQKTALEHGMTLKDASAFNIQYADGKPVLIDTLSFETDIENIPWKPYRQFCEHFLAPLFLASYTGSEMLSDHRHYYGLFPLTLTSKLLPIRSRFDLSAQIHIHSHACFALKQKRLKSGNPKGVFNQKSKKGLIEHLKSSVRKLKPSYPESLWINYEQINCGYPESSFKTKKQIVQNLLSKTGSLNTACDLGANKGTFSRILSEKGVLTIAVDSDRQCIDSLYQSCKNSGEHSILPLCADLTNPSPATGWSLKERPSLLHRLNTDLTIALAVMHHIVIGNNCSFEMLRDFLSGISPWLILEFIPAEDPQVQEMTSLCDRNLTWYNIHHFEESFKTKYSIEERASVPGTGRTLYLMKLKKNG